MKFKYISTVLVEITKFQNNRVRIKRPENLGDFNPFRLTEREVSCRFFTATKIQIFVGP